MPVIPVFGPDECEGSLGCVVRCSRKNKTNNKNKNHARRIKTLFENYGDKMHNSNNIK